MDRFKKAARWLTLGAAMLAGAASTQAVAQAQNFYAGKTIRLIVGFGPGGAFDRVARALAESLPNHIPGKPLVVVENMPGAGSILAANYLFNVAPKDGTVIANINGSITTQELAGQDGITFKSEQFNWVGAMAKTRIVCFINKDAGINSLDDLMKPRAKPVVFGALGGANEITTTPVFLRSLGAQVKVITGYPTGVQIDLATEQKEIDGSCRTWESMKVIWKPHLESGKFLIFMQDGETKAADLPNAQLIVEWLKTPAQKSLWAALTRPQAITRPYTLPPGVPADRVAMIRKAFIDATNDPAFKAVIAKTGDELDPSTGEQVAAVVKAIMSTPPELKGDVVKLLSE